MDTHIIKDTNTKKKISTYLNSDLSLNTSAFIFQSNGSISYDQTHDDDREFEVSDIQMITVKSVSYTSLKDLLPASPSAAIASPTNNSSWHEIPIKNPLVKQAAWAYLQPMSSRPAVSDDKGFFGKFKDVCCSCCQCECFAWINGIVFRSVTEVDDEKVD